MLNTHHLFKWRPANGRKVPKGLACIGGKHLIKSSPSTDGVLEEIGNVSTIREGRLLVDEACSRHNSSIAWTRLRDAYALHKVSQR